MKKNKRRSDCPISFTLDIIGDKWSLLIVRDLMFKGKRTYGEFMGSEERISTNILADRLVMLEGAGIIGSEQDVEKKSRIIYKLTPKGIDLASVMLELVKWGATYDEKTAAPKEFVDRVTEGRENLVNEIKGQLCGKK